MDSSVSKKDEILFLRVCHHISNAVYKSHSNRAPPVKKHNGLRYECLCSITTVFHHNQLQRLPKQGGLCRGPYPLAYNDPMTLFPGLSESGNTRKGFKKLTAHVLRRSRPITNGYRPGGGGDHGLF